MQLAPDSRRGPLRRTLNFFFPGLPDSCGEGSRQPGKEPKPKGMLHKGTDDKIDKAGGGQKGSFGEQPRGKIMRMRGGIRLKSKK